MCSIYLFVLYHLTVSHVLGRVVEIGGANRDNNDTFLNDLPDGVKLFDSQVAGHTFKKHVSGILKAENGFVLKSMTEPLYGEREIKFYENLMSNSTNPDIAALRKLAPEYRGTIKMPFRGKAIDFIKLSDITHAMSEPCVMDIKIGTRTWDPLANQVKIKREQKTYELTKQDLGFCIPGFQVHDIKSGDIRRFGKNYGRKLDQNTAIDALKIFLNADPHISKVLLVQFLTLLRPIQTWALSQTSLRLYASSVLLAYDAKQLKRQMACDCNFNNSSDLADECNTIDTRGWVSVKMIDFAHAFPAEDTSIDTNYLFGIEKLIEIFEEFLRDCAQ